MILLPILLNSCSSSSGLQRASLLHQYVPSAVSLTALNDEFRKPFNFTTRMGVLLSSDSGRTITGDIGIDSSAISFHELFIATTTSAGFAYLNDLHLFTERSVTEIARIGPTFSGSLNLYSIQRYDTSSTKPSTVKDEMYSLLLTDSFTTYILDFLPGCKFQLPDEDSDSRGNFIRLGPGYRYAIRGNTFTRDKQYPLMNTTPVARVLNVEFIQRMN